HRRYLVAPCGASRTTAKCRQPLCRLHSHRQAARDGRPGRPQGGAHSGSRPAEHQGSGGEDHSLVCSCRFQIRIFGIKLMAADPSDSVDSFCASRPVSLVRLLWLLLVLILYINLPAFLCMGLDPDVSQWDLCARTVLEGGVLYQDAVENNLPGMLWLHVLIRSLLGWRPEVL